MLPKELEMNYNETVQKLEGERNVRYVTSAERIGIEKGLQQGMQRGIEQGMQLATKEMAQKMVESGIPAKEVAKIAKLTLDGLEKILKENVTQA